MSRNDSLVQHLSTQFKHTYGYTAGDAEQRACAVSLPLFAQDLVDAGLEGVEVLVEFPLPLSSLRADVVLAGRHPVTQAVSYVVVELKQWSRAAIVDGDPQLCATASHPAGQC